MDLWNFSAGSACQSSPAQVSWIRAPHRPEAEPGSLRFLRTHFHTHAECLSWETFQHVPPDRTDVMEDSQRINLIQPNPTGSNRINRSSSPPENGLNVWRTRFTLRFNRSFTKCGGKLELLPADVCDFGRFRFLHLGSAVIVTSAVGDAPGLGLGQRSAGPLYHHHLP